MNVSALLAKWKISEGMHAKCNAKRILQLTRADADEISLLRARQKFASRKFVTSCKTGWLECYSINFRNFCELARYLHNPLRLGKHNELGQRT